MSDEPRNPMDSMMEIFMVETNDFLNKIEEILIEAEKDPNGLQSATPEIFRIMHTIKSSSAMMSLNNISRLTHKVEDLFYYLRENKPTNVENAKLVDIVLDAVDFIKRNLDTQQNESPDEKIAYIDAYLQSLKSGSPAPSPVKKAEEAPAAASPAAPPAPAPAAAKPAVQLPTPSAAKPAEGERNTVMTVLFHKSTQMLGLRALEVQIKIKAQSSSLTSIPEDPSANEEAIRENGLVLLLKTSKDEATLRALAMKSPFVQGVSFAAPAPEKPAEEAPRQFVERRRDSAAFGKAYANVEITKLDNLVDLVSEILILQMELARDVEQHDFIKSDNAVTKLKKLILNLQEAALSTRMIPIKETFLKMNRLVRDMCRKQQKEIIFTTTGEGTEVDRSIVDNISSPLMHMIRNAIDHGIEPEEERLALGKTAEGHVELSAYTEGRNVVITVTDDGRGFNTKSIREKAIATGKITENAANSMTDEEINSLVFLPGFSTNEQITEFSGRGVGMDVVNESLKKMNGKITVNSQPDIGTRMTLKIPLTMAIIDTVIIRVGDETCALPVSGVEKILFMGAEDSIRSVNGEDVVLLGEECYKILNLFDFYAFSDPIPYEDGIMIIVGGETRKYVVFASEILDRQDVVVKPAPALFKSIKGISGCTILGDGRISLILDTDELLASLTSRSVVKDAAP